MASLRPTATRIAASTTVPSLTRLFTTSLHLSQASIPPESPLFINVPNPPQDQSIEARRDLKPIRGFIPPPRQIFRAKNSSKKPTPAYLRQSAPEPSNARSQIPPASELQAWKRRMAASRRSNIRAGIKGLYARKTARDTHLSSVRRAKLAHHHRLATAPEPEDERLTRSHINTGTLNTAVALDPQRFENALASRDRTTQLSNHLSSLRRDAIQTLYMNARSFILSESDLEAVISREFADDAFSRYGPVSSYHRVENIWDALGEPTSPQTMLRDLERKSGNVILDRTSESARTLKRQKQIAEALTGGGLEDVKSWSAMEKEKGADSIKKRLTDEYGL
ncbi:hypothetical protein GGR57DRAFT_388689 [Xylariaceae sp. FL1272]|nr:hypothetical protein GGR57DRAFT_388689 [Xylariaceae sp. FL1272]